MNKPIHIGKTKKHDPNKSKPERWSYADAEYDQKGWANTEEYLPAEFDLCYLKTDTGRILKGWYTGHGWYGLNVLETHKIKLWKRFDEKE